MEPRKIIKFGNSSYVVTLPYEWIKKNNLVKGDVLNLSENNESIFLSMNKKHDEKKAEINMDNIPLKLFNRELISYYLKNFKYIKIVGKNAIERIEEIRVLKEKLSSIEIVEINKEYILLKDLTSPSELDINKLISEIVEMEKILFDELIKKDEIGTQKHYLISNLDININKLTFLAYKAINYNLDVWGDTNQVKDAIYHWRTVSSFEKVGDIIKRIARYLKNETNEHNYYIGKTLEEVKIYFEFIIGLLEKDVNLENNLRIYLDKKQSLLREIEDLRAQLQDDLNLFLVISQLLKDLLGDLDDVVLSVIDLCCK